MRTLNPSLAWAFLSSVVAAYSVPPLGCEDGNRTQPCIEPLGAVTTVVPDAQYLAKLPCLDCAVIEKKQVPQYKNESALFFDIARSQDHGHLLLNGQPIFPSLTTSPRPPTIYTRQVTLNFSRADLTDSLSCWDDARVNCLNLESTLGERFLDYDYAVTQLDVDHETHWEKWEVTFDAIGRSGEAYNRSDQLMLRIVVSGTKKEMYDGFERDTPTDSSLFGPSRPALGWKYDIKIAAVELVERSYTFPVRAPRTFWGRIRHFFACDIEGEGGHIVYHSDDWDRYGQYGTLRNELGKVIHEWPWAIIGLVIGGVLASVLVMYGTYWLYLLAMQQKELARWQGIDAVWERMRQEPSDEDEADGLLADGYRDYADDDTVYGYTDEVVANKPLPAKPLPDKPLPPLPLIDA